MYVLVGVFRLEEEQLGHDEIRNLVLDPAHDEDDTVLSNRE